RLSPAVISAIALPPSHMATRAGFRNLMSASMMAPPSEPRKGAGRPAWQGVCFPRAPKRGWGDNRQIDLPGSAWVDAASGYGTRSVVDGLRGGASMSARTGRTRWRGVPVVGAVIAVVVLVSTALAGPSGVSSTPFGIPNDQVPNPAKTITAVSGDRSWYWTQQTRSEVLARHGVVATSQPIAAQAGLQVLKDGG